MFQCELEESRSIDIEGGSERRHTIKRKACHAGLNHRKHVRIGKARLDGYILLGLGRPQFEDSLLQETGEAGGGMGFSL